MTASVALARATASTASAALRWSAAEPPLFRRDRDTQEALSRRFSDQIADSGRIRRFLGCSAGDALAGEAVHRRPELFLLGGELQMHTDRIHRLWALGFCSRLWAERGGFVKGTVGMPMIRESWRRCPPMVGPGPSRRGRCALPAS